jgi:hypothetical protein
MSATGASNDNPVLAALNGVMGGTQGTGGLAQGNQLLQLITRIVLSMEGGGGSGAFALFTPTPVTIAGDLTITQTTGFFSIRKTVPAITTVNLPVGGTPYIIADGAGNAGTYPITIAPPGGYTIMGAATYVLAFNWQSVGLSLDGSNYLIW